MKQCDRHKARAMIAATLHKVGDTSGKYPLDSLLQSGIPYELQNQAGETEGVCLVKADGNELWVLAAAGNSDRDLTEQITLQLEELGRAHGFTTIGFQTKRRGLVKKAAAHGYVIDGYILRKKI